MLNALNWCSSRLVWYQDSKSFHIQIISFCFSAQKINEVKYYVGIESVMMNKDTNFFVHLFWEDKDSFEPQIFKYFNQVVFGKNF